MTMFSIIGRISNHRRDVPFIYNILPQNAPGNLSEYSYVQHGTSGWVLQRESCRCSVRFYIPVRSEPFQDADINHEPLGTVQWGFQGKMKKVNQKKDMEDGRSIDGLLKRGGSIDRVNL